MTTFNHGKTLIKAIEDELSAIHDLDLIEIHNAWCEDTEFYEDTIYRLTEQSLYDVLAGTDLVQVLTSIKGDFNYFDKFFVWCNDKLESFNDFYPYVDIKTLSEWLIENERYKNFGFLEIVIDDFDD